MSTPYFLLDARMRQRQQRVRQERKSLSPGRTVTTPPKVARSIAPAFVAAVGERGETTFAFTARSRDEAKGGRDTQATGKVSAVSAEAAREKVRRAYRFADNITVTPLTA